MYKKVMVTLDGSDLAEVALPCAEEISGRLGAELILAGVSEAHIPRYQHIYRNYLAYGSEAAAKRVKEHYGAKAARVVPLLLTGHAAEEIIDYAEKNDVDLIVMATHGYSGVRRWALGSIADKVVRRTSKPVLLIRAKDARPAVGEKDLCTRAVVPLDGSILAEVALPYVKELVSPLAPPSKAEISLLHVISPPQVGAAVAIGETPHEIDDEGLRRIKNQARDYLDQVGRPLWGKGVVVRSEVRVGKAADEIIKFANKVGAGVVIMSTHGRSGLDRLVLGSVTNRVLRGANIPVMLVRPS